MTSQGSVAIGGYNWVVSIMSTPTELAAGLSGVTSIPSWSGMLFDMGSDRSYIAINMAEMLFALDIVFINGVGGVVGVLRNVQPGAENVWFEAANTLGAKWFLEVNAGEAEGVSVGDSVVIEGAGAAVSTLEQLITAVVTMGIMIPIAAGVAAGLGISALKKPAEKKNAGKWKMR